jgi:hypothetical protein
VTINGLAKDLQGSESVKRLLVSARPHDAVFTGTAETRVESTNLSATVNTPGDFLLMELRVSITATAVLSDTLEEVARSVLRKGRGIGEFVPGSVVAVETGSSEVDRETGVVRTRVELRGDFASGIDSNEIRDAVKGKSEADARSLLQSRYGIQDATVAVSPGWAPWLPRFNFRIDVQLKSPAENEPADGGSLQNGQATTATSTPPGN